jgi:pSer/pThr/pTyr-binding forkhead associated (FHA) protein
MTDLHPENVPLPVNRPEDLRLLMEASRRRGGTGPASGPALPVLRLLSLDARPRDHPLAAGENLVGRLPDNDVVIPSPYVSRRHCVILVSPGGACVIRDLGSADGVHVDGERVGRPLPLRNGSVIRLSDQLLVLLLLPSADGAAGAGPTTAAER